MLAVRDVFLAHIRMPHLRGRKHSRRILAFATANGRIMVYHVNTRKRQAMTAALT